MKNDSISFFADDEAGIRYQLSRMSVMIVEGSQDVGVFKEARAIVEESGSKDPLEILGFLHTWLRSNFDFVPDPCDVDIIRTPMRQLRRIADGHKMTGDADDMTIVSLAFAAALGFTQLKMIVGGSKEHGLYDVWGAVLVGGVWHDFNLQEKFGEQHSYERIEETPVVFPLVEKEPARHKADRAEAWPTLVKLEPQLGVLLDKALKFRPAKDATSFCANCLWEKQFKPELCRLVGWDRVGDAQDDFLQTVEAYDTAYDTIYEALPGCFNCDCA